MTILKKITSNKWVMNLVGLRALYQIIYLLFNLVIIKNLSVAEYGIYSYILSLTVYFSSIPLLGLPVYLQKSMAQQGEIEWRYFKVTILSSIIAFFIAFYIMPPIPIYQKCIILFVILFNCLLTIPVSVNDGLGNYLFQHRFSIFNSLWMVACMIGITSHVMSMNLSIILIIWAINIFASFGILFAVIKNLFQKKLTLSGINSETSSSPRLLPNTALDLLFLYAISLPDGFSRFYDRFLVTKFFDAHFLGTYSFNLMVVAMIYALFIRPLNSILFTKLAQSYHSLEDCIPIIKRYYMVGLTVYFICFIMYLLFSTYILQISGLEKYNHTTYMFFICMINAVLYLLTVPYISIITLNNNRKTKLIYCLGSLMIFNIPLVLLLITPSQTSYFIGFISAYFLNLLLAIRIDAYAYRVFSNSFSRVDCAQKGMIG